MNTLFKKILKLVAMALIIGLLSYLSFFTVIISKWMPFAFYIFLGVIVYVRRKSLITNSMIPNTFMLVCFLYISGRIFVGLVFIQNFEKYIAFNFLNISTYFFGLSLIAIGYFLVGFLLVEGINKLKK